MIGIITDEKELAKQWMQMLAVQSEVHIDRIVNGLSIRGVDLSKRITSTVKLSLDLSDAMIIFEIVTEDTPDEQFSELEEDDTITMYSYYKLKLTIYGMYCSQIAKKLKARLETQKCRQYLFDKGIYFSKVSGLQPVNDFMNETIWPRVDMSIDFGCRLNITQIDDYNSYEEMQKIVAEETN